MAAETNSVWLSRKSIPKKGNQLTDIGPQPIALKRLEQISADVRPYPPNARKPNAGTSPQTSAPGHEGTPG